MLLDWACLGDALNTESYYLDYYMLYPSTFTSPPAYEPLSTIDFPNIYIFLLLFFLSLTLELYDAFIAASRAPYESFLDLIVPNYYLFRDWRVGGCYWEVPHLLRGF